MKKKLKLLTVLLLFILLIAACSSSKAYNFSDLVDVKEADLLVVYNLKDNFYTADPNIIRGVFSNLNDLEAKQLSSKERDEIIRGRYIDNSMLFSTFMKNDKIIGAVHIYSEDEIIIFDDTMESQDFNAYIIVKPEDATEFVSKLRSLIEY